MGYLTPALEQLLAQQANSQNHPQVAADSTIFGDTQGGALPPVGAADSTSQCLTNLQTTFPQPDPVTGQYTAAQLQALSDASNQCISQQQTNSQQSQQQQAAQAGQEADGLIQKGQESALNSIQNIQGCLLNALSKSADINACYQDNLAQ